MKRFFLPGLRHKIFGHDLTNPSENSKIISGNGRPLNPAGKVETRMEKIESFRVDHTRLLPGLYVSRRDGGDEKPVTTFDLRFTRPNREPVMDMPAIHTIEHLGATYLRSSERKDEIIYFGPMGCRTGFYLVMFGRLEAEDALPLVRDALRFILDFSGPIPGATAKECGNYQEQNLDMAKYYALKYVTALETPQLKYPE